MSEPVFHFTVPEPLEGGVYANMLSVWHSPWEFTLDFAVTMPAEQHTAEDGTAQLVIPCKVVARVKVPPEQMLDILKAINAKLTDFEQAKARTASAEVGPPLYPPPDLDDNGDGGA